jgi:hypothetical protein
MKIISILQGKKMAGGPTSNCDNQDCWNPNCTCEPCGCSKEKACGYPERNYCGDAFVSSIAASSSTEMG